MSTRVPGAFQFLQNLTRVIPVPHGAELRAGRALVQVRAVCEGVFRVRVLPDHVEAPDEPFSYALDPDLRLDPPVTTIDETRDAVVMTAGGWRAVAQRNPTRLSFEAPNGHAFARDSFGPGWRGERFHVWKAMMPGARYYGLGEKAYQLERSGHFFTNWNTDTPGYATESDPLYKTFPFFICLERRPGAPSAAFGIFLDNSHRSWFDFGGQAVGHFAFGAEAGEIRYYVIGGPTPLDVLRRYTTLTGRTPLPPRWALGYQQSRWSYYPDEAVEHLVARFRSRGIPLDAVYLDIHYMHDYRVFTWDRHRFPDHRKLLAGMRKQGVQPIIIVDPGVKAEEGYAVAAEGLAGDHFVRYPDGSVYEGKVWPGACYFPDFTRPETRTWFGSWCRKALDDGVTAFWTDMNEPSNHSHRTLPDHVVHDMEGRGGTHLEAHNLYGMQMARAVFEAAASHRPDDRPFVLTRAAYAGTQRYAAVWTGDNVSSWEHLGLALPMLLSLGLSGMPFAGTDVGGFFGTPSAELFVRWMQLGAFTPLFRNHSIFGSPHQEPWAFGEVAEEAAREAVELRYRLLPYLYTLFHEHTRNGLPILRPLVLHYPDDPHVASLDDQFMFGGQMLVAPVLREGAEARTVYLPEGTWYELGSAGPLPGARTVLAAAPLSQIPVFVRAGTCLPLGPVLQHVNERAVHTLDLEVYPGEGTSYLYEDDGQSQAYRTGACCLHRFDLSMTDDVLHLRHVREGRFEDGIRHFHIRLPGIKHTATDVQTVTTPFPDEPLRVDASFSEVSLPLSQ